MNVNTFSLVVVFAAINATNPAYNNISVKDNNRSHAVEKKPKKTVVNDKDYELEPRGVNEEVHRVIVEKKN